MELATYYAVQIIWLRETYATYYKLVNSLQETNINKCIDL